MYRCQTTTLEGFVQQLVCYIASGYRYFVVGQIPEHKDPQRVDQNVIEKYGIALSKYQRARRKQKGEASVQYLRFQNFFVLIATPPVGAHEFYSAEANAIRDIRKQPIRCAGYSISCRQDGSAAREGIQRWRAHVRIDREPFLELKAALLEASTRRSRRELELTLREIPYEPYAPIRRQLLEILRAMNIRRDGADLQPLRSRCLRFRRVPVLPFGSDESGRSQPAILAAIALLGLLVFAWQVEEARFVMAVLVVYLLLREP
ncbi:MAG: hypothetical protein NXI30_15690 [bacterium]|nr:hypothetical protein [bacterium]